MHNIQQPAYAFVVKHVNNYKDSWSHNIQDPERSCSYQAIISYSLSLRGAQPNPPQKHEDASLEKSKRARKEDLEKRIIAQNKENVRDPLPQVRHLWQKVGGT